MPLTLVAESRVHDFRTFGEAGQCCHWCGLTVPAGGFDEAGRTPCEPLDL